MRRVHLAWIIPVSVAFGAGVSSLAFLFARAFLDPVVQFYFNDGLIRTERQIMWHDIAGLILTAVLIGVGLALFVVSLAIVVGARLLMRAKPKLEARTAEMQAQRPPVVRVERRQA